MVSVDEVVGNFFGIPNFDVFIEMFQKNNLEQPHQNEYNADKEHEIQPDFLAQLQMSMSEVQIYIPFLSR